MKKQWLSFVCVVALALGLMVVPTQAAESPVTMKAQGWYETICAELTGVADGDVKAVSYTDVATGAETALAGEDFKYLVRDMEGGVRVDIPGVKAGTYDLTVMLEGNKRYVALGVEVKAYDRSGFAHKVHTTDESGAITGIVDYTEGVGAYNDDGTLKENATVLYVTEENKNTVSLTQGFTVTGIGNILNCKGWDQNQRAAGNRNDTKLLLKMADAGRPLVVRIVGEVTKPEGVTAWGSTANGGSKDDNGGMCIMEYAGNITIEGVGPDATVNGWGFAFSADGTGRTALGNKRPNCGQNIEVRNINFRNVPEDCVSITGAQGGTEIKDSAEHVWVHNNSFVGPHGLPDASADQDKAEGDGAVDFRNGEYMTMSYNYFYDYHKTSLVGSSDSVKQYHVTWHHNWWKDVQSRSPLCRQANMHIYNNLYDGQKNYCMSLRANCYVYSEYNTFRGCKDPVKHEGGVCKTKGDVFDNCTGTNNAAETVTSTNPYADFESSSTLSYIPDGKYELQTAAEAEATVRAEAGVQKKNLDVTGYSAAAYGTLGELNWFYTNEGDVIVPDAPANATILAAGYENGGSCLKAAPVKDGKATLGAGMELGKLFWLSDNYAPQCPAAGWGEAK